MRSIIFLLLISSYSLPIYSAPAYNLNEEKIVICAVGKNVALTLGNMIQKIESLGACFKDYQVIIYENNSTDNTPQILNEWAKNNGKVILTCEQLNPEQLHHRTIAHALRDKAPNRMGLIAYARNEVLKRAMDEQFHDFKFLVMTDFDFTRGWDMQEVISSFNVEIPWDCITANSIDYGNHYYDRYAYRDEQFPLGPELIGEEFWHDIDRFPIYFDRGSGLHKVYSAFGGIAIYKREALKNCAYSGYVTPDFERLMVNIINNKMSQQNRQYLIYQQILGRNTTPLPVLFQANCGYDSFVVCEHSTLHSSMILNGHDKIYVNPAMVCYY